jgi:tetratricopeptide (TPR) repeat protein
MTMQKALSLTLALAFAATAVLRAADTAPAVAAATPVPETKQAPTPVAKNDAPGSIAPGNKLNEEGKFDEALAYFEGIGEQSVANGHSKREPWRLIGMANSESGMGKFDKAAEFSQKALDIDGKSVVAWNHLGSAQAQAGKRADAIATYTKGIAALKAAKMDTTKLEANLAELQAAVEASKPKAQKTAEAKAAADTAAAAAVSPSASAPAAK